MMTQLEGALTDRLSRGEAAPGGPGACGQEGCAHAKVWHSRYGKHPCERCDCPSYQDQAAPATALSSSASSTTY